MHAFLFTSLDNSCPLVRRVVAGEIGAAAVRRGRDLPGKKTDYE